VFQELFRNLFGNVPVEFRSAFSLEESVSRLRERTSRSLFHSLFRQSAVGRVTADSVRLQRVVPFFGNSFKPIFVGKFLAENGCVILRGRFTTFSFTKIFMVIWFSFFIAILVLEVLGEFGFIRFKVVPPQEASLAAISFLFPYIFLVGGALFIKFGWWLSRGDMKYLALVIKAALNRNA